MYNVGDAVFHPSNGAGVITGLERMPAIEEDLRFYRIRMSDRNDTVLRVPVSKAAELGLRPALPGQDVHVILEILSAVPQELPGANKERYKACQDRLDLADTRSLAALVRDLAWRQTEADRLNAPAQRIYNRAKRLLAGELAVSQSMTLQTAEDQIRRALEQRVTPNI